MELSHPRSQEEKNVDDLGLVETIFILTNIFYRWQRKDSTFL